MPIEKPVRHTRDGEIYDAEDKFIAVMPSLLAGHVEEIVTAINDHQHLLEENARLRQALEHYQWRCDYCEHAFIEHPEGGVCTSVECYAPRCNQYVNMAQEALKETK